MLLLINFWMSCWGWRRGQTLYQITIDIRVTWMVVITSQCKQLILTWWHLLVHHTPSTLNSKVLQHSGGTSCVWNTRKNALIGIILYAHVVTFNGIKESSEWLLPISLLDSVKFSFRNLIRDWTLWMYECHFSRKMVKKMTCSSLQQLHSGGSCSRIASIRSKKVELRSPIILHQSTPLPLLLYPNELHAYLVMLN